MACKRPITRCKLVANCHFECSVGHLCDIYSLWLQHQRLANSQSVINIQASFFFFFTSTKREAVAQTSSNAVRKTRSVNVCYVNIRLYEKQSIGYN